MSRFFPYVLGAAVLLLSGCLAKQPTPAVSAVQYEDVLLRLTEPLVFTFAGDIMAHRPNYNMQDYSRIYSDIEDELRLSHLNFANLEFVIDPDREMSSYPTFNVHPEYVQAAIDAGFNVFSLANNHTADFGREGIAATAKSVSQLAASNYNPLAFSGIASEGFKLTIIPLEHYKIGFVAVTGILNNWTGSNLIQFTFYDSTRTEFLEWLSEVHTSVDFMVVSYHDGVEYEIQPDYRKKRFMQQMIHAGADIVWGHHPHVLQPVELIETQREQQTVEGLLLYSTGNFISSQTWFLEAGDYDTRRAYTGDSALFRVCIERTESGLRVGSVDATPITHYITDDYAVVVRRMKALIDSNELDEDWLRYYKNRWQRMQPLLKTPQVTLAKQR